MAQAAKVCVSCSKDVSAIPRRKDDKGRYFCEPCSGGAASAGASSAGATDVMAQLLGASKIVNAPKCVSCGTAMLGGAVVCVHCGHHQESGRAIATKISERRRSVRGGR